MNKYIDEIADRMEEKIFKKNNSFECLYIFIVFIINLLLIR